MKRATTLLSFSSLLFLSLQSQNLSFTRTYGGAAYDDARCMALADDGCFVFTGLTNSSADSLGDMYLTKVNAAGAVLWTKYYGRPEEDGGNSVLRTSDGGYLIIGHTALSYGLLCDGYLVRTDADGNEKWRLLVGKAYDDVCDAAIEMEDGSFITVGRVENADTHTFKVLFVKISPNGQQLFFKELDSKEPSVAFKIAQATDGNLLIAGYATRKDHADTEMMVLKCTPDGVVLWQATCGTNLNDRAYSLVPTPDGGCIAVGGTADAADNPVGMLLAQFDPKGFVTAQNTVLSAPQSGFLYDIVATSDGRFAIAGILRPLGTENYQPVIALLDDKLSPIAWQKVDMPGNCRTRGMLEDGAGNLIICGNQQGGIGRGDDVFIAKLPQAHNTTGVQEFRSTPYMLFPNQFSTFTYLKIGDQGQTKMLTLSRPDGSVVRRTTFDTTELIVYREGLETGPYFFTVRDGSGRLLISGKLMVE